MSETAFSPELCVTERRGNDRRKRNIPVAVERRSGKDRRAAAQSTSSSGSCFARSVTAGRFRARLSHDSMTGLRSSKRVWVGLRTTLQYVA